MAHARAPDGPIRDIPWYQRAEFREEVVQAAVGSEWSWAKRFSDVDLLVEASYFRSWVDANGEGLSSDDAGVESGMCDQFGITYDYDGLDLPHDVRPTTDPWISEAASWKSIVQEYRQRGWAPCGVLSAGTRHARRRRPRLKAS